MNEMLSCNSFINILNALQKWKVYCLSTFLNICLFATSLRTNINIRPLPRLITVPKIMKSEINSFFVKPISKTTLNFVKMRITMNQQSIINFIHFPWRLLTMARISYTCIKNTLKANSFAEKDKSWWTKSRFTYFYHHFSWCLRKKRNYWLSHFFQTMFILCHCQCLWIISWMGSKCI